MFNITMFTFTFLERDLKSILTADRNISFCLELEDFIVLYLTDQAR